MGVPYRDSLETMRERARALEVEVEELESGYTSFFWEEVAPRIRLALPKPFSSLPAASDPEVLSQAIAAREERLMTLQRLERDLPLIEHEWRRPSDEVPDCRKSTLFDLQGSVTRAFVKDPYIEISERVLRQLEADHPFQVEKDGKGARVASLSSDGAPFKLRCESYMTQRHGDWTIDVTVQTTVPRLFGDVRLSPQGFGSELLIALRMKRDIKLGARDFDGYFVVQGHEPTAQMILDADVQRSLLEIAKEDIPKLMVGKGVATLLWHFEPNLRCLQAAIDALKGIRRAPPARALKEAVAGSERFDRK